MLPPKDTTALMRLQSIAGATIDHVSIAVTNDATSTRATLRFRAKTRVREAHDTRLLFELSTGGAVTGMKYAIGGEPRIEATMHRAENALEAYEATVRQALDPAILRWVSAGERTEQYELAVFPVSRGMPANVEIHMTLPNATRLLFDPGPYQLARVDVTRNGDILRWTGVTKPRVLSIPAVAETWMDTDPTERLVVDATSTLYAGDQVTPPPQIFHRNPAAESLPAVTYSDRRFELRKHIRARATALRHCYELGVLIEPTLSPDAKLALDIGTDGAVSDVTVSGDLSRDDIRSCIADEVASWSFGPASETRTVRQDIDLLHLD
jgi:hypothetical protein